MLKHQYSVAHWHEKNDRQVEVIETNRVLAGAVVL